MLANHPNVLSGGGVATNIIGGTGLFADGTVAAPSISFLADQDTGIYRIGANNIGVAANGAKVLDVATTGLKVSGGGNSTIAFEATSTPSLHARSIQFETNNDPGKTFITANTFGYARNAAPPFNQTLTIGTNGFSITNDIIFELGLSGVYTEKLRLADNVATFAGAVTISSSTASSGVGTGALQVAGGIYAGAASVFATDITINGARAGIGVGSVASNTLFGNNSLTNASQTGTNNSAFGQYSLYSNTSGANNTSVGMSALAFNSTASGNSAFGSYALYATTTGGNNTAAGGNALRTNSSGSSNVSVGVNSFYYNSTGSNNVGLGFYAGAYETGSNAFYVDNQDRTNTAGDKAKALLYGTFNGTAASQTLAINAVVSILNTTAAAVAAASTHKVSMVIGGVQYYLLASNV